MIIRIQASGGSFRGAGLYYLHDKAADASLPKELKPSTDERVWFTDTRNCLNTNPQAALDEMWRTAEDQAYLKKCAGVRASGRACADPVKTISLSWHKEDQPTPDQMIAAADGYLTHMGWADGHQAVFIGHRDTEHRHIHIVLNRVNCETGRTLDDFREQVRSSDWARAYQKEHGQDWCPQREINAAAREEARQGRTHDREHGEKPKSYYPKPANDHLSYKVIQLTRGHEQRFDQAEAELSQDQQKQDWKELRQQQKAERLDFYADGKRLFRATRVAIYKGVKEEMRDEWAEHYREQKTLSELAGRTLDDAVLRALHFAKSKDWEKAEAAVQTNTLAYNDIHDNLSYATYDLEKKQEDLIKARQEAACAILMEQRKAEYEDLKQRQRDERAALTAAHAQGNTLADISGPLREPANQIELRDRPGEPVPEKTREERPQRDPVPEDRDVAPERREHKDRPPARGLSDGIAGGIGQAASYIADQLGELFAPTPPEVREANARAEAKREAEAPAPVKDDPWKRHIENALRALDEAEQKRSRDYYTERREAQRDR